MRAVFWLTVAIAVVASTTGLVNHRRHRAHSHNPAVDPATTEWKPPLPGDCRSPCPALNTLANHGLLPRDGKNIDLAAVKNALLNIYGLGPSFGKFFAEAAFKKFADPATQKMSLCDLLINIHQSDQPSHSTGIEHSASLSRVDRSPAQGFSRLYDASQRDPVPAQSNIVLASSTDGQKLTLADMARARDKLWAHSFAANPALKTDKLHTTEAIIASTEACLLLGVLSGNSNQGTYQISKSYATSFLQHERFPQGWKKSATPMGWPQVTSCLTRMGLSWAGNRVSAILRVAKEWILRK
jgi:hypothetical protein